MTRFEERLRALAPDPVYGDDGTRIATSSFVKVSLAERDALTDAVEALRYMADYRLTGTEQTLHIDFQGKARDALARLDGAE